MGVVSPRSSSAQRDGPRPGRHAPPSGLSQLGSASVWQRPGMVLKPYDAHGRPPVMRGRLPQCRQRHLGAPGSVRPGSSNPARATGLGHVTRPGRTSVSQSAKRAGDRWPSRRACPARPCVQAAPLLFLLAREGLLWNTANTQQPWCPRYPPLLPGLSWGRQPAPRAGGRQAGRLRVSSASRLRQRETGCHLPASGAEIPGRAPREGVPVGRRPPSRTSPVRPAAAAVPACARARVCVRVQARVRSRVRMRV